MCTAVTYSTKDTYFGRTFDWDVSYGEQIVFVPRNYSMHFRKMPTIDQHYALLGMAVVADHVPLFYDAINEKGLGMAGLNFPENTDYKEINEKMDNITPFEFIPWILGQCGSVKEARALLTKMNLVKISFSEQYPLSPLHWIIADQRESITVECVKEGLKVYNNSVGVLTNNPPFDMQMFYLSNFMQLQAAEPSCGFIPAEKIEFCQEETGGGEKFSLRPYSRGMGAMGLPGDWSSASRFVRAAFAKFNAAIPDHLDEESQEELEGVSVSQFFHILGTVEQKRGCVLLEKGEDEANIYEISIYTSCCNLTQGKYYYKTYDNSNIHCVDMYREDLGGKELVTYGLRREPEICYQNESPG